MRAKENIKLFYGGLLIFWIISIKINAQTADSMLNMSLEELMNIKVVTASNISEQLSKAPANVIVIDKNDIQLRGYTCMSDIFDDLPGMDISKPLGFQRVRNSMRGYRTSFGDSYLFMVDGIVFNQLWYNEATAQSAVPISNVERVEIVYGPASSVYGANAFMGVINVITKKDDQKDGVSANLISNFGKNAYNGDYSLFYKKEDFRMSIATRFENWNLFDRIDNTKYRWTNTSLLTDRSLWGGLVDNTQLTSPPAINNRGVDLRTYYKTTELGFHYYQTDQGYGMIFPYDKSLASQQPMSDYSVYLRHIQNISEKISLQTLIRYRTSNVDGDCNYIEGYNVDNTGNIATTIGGISVNPGESARVIDYSTWGVLNKSYTFSQSMEYALTTKLSLSAGYKYEYKDLQMGWQDAYGNAYAPSVLKVTSPGFLTDPMVLQRRYENRIIWKDNGGYLQLKYAFNEGNILNFGSRIDNNSTYGTAVTLRGGYVFRINRITAKLLYGEAFREPSPQTLYGAWTGVGSNPNLEPERSKTIESSIGYTSPQIYTLLDAYYINNTNTIESFTGGAKNLGKRNIFGLDILVTTLISSPIFKQLKIWGYGSFILKEEQQQFDNIGNPTNMDIIGDLSHTKIYAGVSGTTNKHLAFSLRSRFIGDKNTVLTNPIRKINGYLLLDANFICKDVLFKGLNITFQLNNLFNTQYFNPGTRAANAGDTPGHWENNAWIGSSGWNNSLMPQPGRYALIGFQLSL